MCLNWLTDLRLDLISLAISELFKRLNQKVIMNIDSVPDPKLLEPNATGVMFIKGDIPVNQAVGFFPHGENPTSGLMAMFSIFKGIIEDATSIADWSPGYGGSKPTHKTARGLIEIKQDLAVRMKTARRLLMVAATKQGEAIYDLSLQYLTVPWKFPVTNPNNQNYQYEQTLTWEDIQTEGRGFTFKVEADPSFGDTELQRQSMSELYGVVKDYNMFVRQTGNPTAKIVDVEAVMKRLLNSYGGMDISNMLITQNKLMTPEEEFKAMLGGNFVEPNPLDNHTEHIGKHINHINSQGFQQGIATGKINPGAMQLHQTHIEHHAAAMRLVLANPMLAAGIQNEQDTRGQNANQ